MAGQDVAAIEFESLHPSIKLLYEMELPEEGCTFFRERFSSQRAKSEHLQFRDKFAKGHMPNSKKDRRNLEFFRNNLISQPEGAKLDEIHRSWKGDYDTLEFHHGYIQWLFPLPVAGMNFQAQPLQQHEADAIKADPEAKARLIKSYALMLDFYGMELEDSETGKIVRGANYPDRYRNLSTHTHNFLRITRILKCLGLLGYPHFVAPFLVHVVWEILCEGNLTALGTSLRGFFVETLLNDNDRCALLGFLEQFD